MRPRLRDELQITRVGPTSYVLTDPASGARYTFSPPERQLLHLLDGQRELAEIRRDFRARFGHDVSERSLRDFVHQLDAAGLLRRENGEKPRPAAPPPRDLLDRHPHVPHSASVRINRRLDWLVLLAGWTLHPLLLPAHLALIAVGVVALVRNFDLYLFDMTALADEVPLWVLLPLSLAQTILFMNLPRELAVAMACRRFGGWVRWFGVFWLNGLLPFFLCDTGDSISRMSTRGRWTVLLAGMVCQSWLGAFYTLMWRMNEPLSFPAIFGMLQILPWMVATVLHLNVFVRLDAYRILCVLRGDARLWERARAETDAWLAGRPAPEPLAPRERFWLRVYGLGWHAWVWILRILYIVGGTAWLLLRMGGSGALLAAVAFVVWYRQPIGRWLMSAGAGSLIRAGGRWWIRWPVRIVILAGLIALGFAPYAHEVGGECFVAPAAEHGIRSQLADEIVKIHVDEGTWVQPGDLIATLSGREVLAACDERAAELREAQADLDLLLAGAREEDIAMAEQEVQLWRVRVEYAETELNRVKDLVERGVGDAEELRRAQVERDSSAQLLQTAQEKLKRVREGARPEEIEAARARVESARARLAYAQTQKELLQIRTPIAGRVITPNVRQRQGQVVAAGELIAVVQDTRTLRVVIDADEMATVCAPGQRAICRFWGLGGQAIEGHVASVTSAAFDEHQLRIDSVRTDREALVEQASRRPRTSYHVRVYVDLARQDPRLRPGMTGEARIVIGPGRFWEALWRPVARYFRVAVWSWLP